MASGDGGGERTGAGATLAERLGFARDARVVVLHADDIGMCHAANVGAFEALAAGPVRCGSLMVPCPWFPEAAAHAREHPELDLGVHLTLNSEWEGYRWPPRLGAAAVPSLVAEDGCLPRTVEAVLSRARPEEVERELRAQIEYALDAGVDVTHLDSHMGTVLFPPLSRIYANLAREFRLPLFVVKPDPAQLPAGFAEAAAQLRAEASALEREGFPVFDGFDSDSLGFAPGQGLVHNQRRLDGIGPGVHYLICHPAALHPELEALTPDAHCRDFERAFYGGDAGRLELERRGIEVIGMRALRRLVRGEVAARSGAAAGVSRP